MSMFEPRQRRDFTPKAVKFSDLYKFGANSKNVSSAAIDGARKALAAAGYSSKQISLIISDDKKIPVAQMKEIVGHLNKNQIYGFGQNPDIMIKNYLVKEKIKAQNISRIIHEHMLESQEEDLVKNRKTTSLNTMGKGAVGSLNNRGIKPSSPAGSSAPSSPTRINLPF